MGKNVMDFKLIDNPSLWSRGGGTCNLQISFKTDVDTNSYGLTSPGLQVVISVGRSSERRKVIKQPPSLVKLSRE